MWKPGELDAYQLPSGTIIVKNNIHSSQCKFVKVAIYCRVSSAENNSNLEFQAERLLNYCSSKGYSVVRVVKELGSGVNDNRHLVVKLLQENDYDLVVCEHKDRLSRVGFNYLNESSLNSKLIETLK